MAIFDISQLSDQNPWWIDKNNIQKDFKLVELDKLEHQWDPNLRHFIRLDTDVIYTIRGPRQVGKTTLIKIIIKDLLFKKKVKPENILFWSCERNNAEELHQILQTYLDWKLDNQIDRKYIFLDEICSVKDWSKEIIYFANRGVFVNSTIVLTGSHSMDLKHSTERMPGRRGGVEDDPLDKILLPMKFSEFVNLRWPDLIETMIDFKVAKTTDKQEIILNLFEGKGDKTLQNLSLYRKQLDSLFERYLLSGGIPATINELETTGKISMRLFNVYYYEILFFVYNPKTGVTVWPPLPKPLLPSFLTMLLDIRL